MFDGGGLIYLNNLKLSGKHETDLVFKGNASSSCLLPLLHNDHQSISHKLSQRSQ